MTEKPNLPADERDILRFLRACILPGVAFLSLVADQVTKHIVMTNLEMGRPWNPITPLKRFVSITYVTNTGAAFGLFADQSFLFVAIAIAVLAAIFVYRRYLTMRHWLIRLSLGLQLGGALGNILDRLRYGYVVDFLDFKVWPIFNLADSSICIGVAILAYYMLREKR
jgi:signal peptidase II